MRHVGSTSVADALAAGAYPEVVDRFAQLVIRRSSALLRLYSATPTIRDWLLEQCLKY